MCAQCCDRQRGIRCICEELAVGCKEEEGVEVGREVESEEGGEAFCEKEGWRTGGHHVGGKEVRTAKGTGTDRSSG